MDRDAVEPNRKVRIEYHNLPEGKYAYYNQHFIVQI